MNIESFREYCLSLPYTSEDMPFGDEYLIIRVCGKIFACIGLERPDYFVLKCDPDYAVELRETHEEIEPAWHWNKKYWNQLRLSGSLDDVFIGALIRHSYEQVVKKLPKKQREEIGEY
ncbi:MAG: MmcQ/YjbR family DNA-binding protein [Paenibacillus sp.]|nr:MmcQ/YjbR family DNA-binding protein [Paenibacillus sp.]